MLTFEPIWCIITVSYTHLDVYKRQLEDKIIDLLSKKTKCPVCGEECISWYKKGFYTNFWKEKDVYKRQK